MQFNALGGCSINDEDEYFCEDGRVILVLNEHQFIHSMKELAKIWDDGNKMSGQMLEIYKLLKESYESNYAICCGITFKSIRKKVICPSCGQIVSLT